MRDSGPFHFCLGKAAVPYDFPRSAFILDLTVIVSSVSSSASNEGLGKASQPPAIQRQKTKEYNNAWMTDFPGHRHEDDVDTGKSGVSA